MVLIVIIYGKIASCKFHFVFATASLKIKVEYNTFSKELN